jgi:hypothetical protein
VTVTNDGGSSPCDGQGGDADDDGVCADLDCDDNNANVPTTPGTSCNDSNPNTANDTIQEDGCTCEGEPIGSGDSDCDNISISSSNGAIVVSGLDGAPVSSLQILNSSWQQEYACFANCSATETIDVAPGTYQVYAKYYNAGYALLCQQVQSITVIAGGGGGGNSCDNFTDGGEIGFFSNCANSLDYCPATDGAIEQIRSCQFPSGGSGAIEYMWLQSTTTSTPPTSTTNDPNWSIVSGANQSQYTPQSVNETTWFIRYARRAGCVDYVGESNVVTVSVDANCDNTGGNTGGGVTDPNCGDITISANGGDIIVTGLDGASVTSVQIFTASWATHFACFADCNSPIETIPATDGTYHVYVKYYTAAYTLICTVEETIDVVNGQAIMVNNTGNNGLQETLQQRLINNDVNTEINTAVTTNPLDFTLFPNPANDFITIGLEQVYGKDITLRVYSHLGQVLKMASLNDVQETEYLFNLQDLPRGYYLISMEVPGEQVIVKRLVLRR